MMLGMKEDPVCLAPVILHTFTGDVGAEDRAEADTRLVMDEVLPWVANARSSPT